ncbi:MAG TPA: pyruvate kinase [Thermoanaerobaculia bacterium]|nr:pyruvate kinase [Thermoanaerobaculia bacterium]
MDRKTKIIATLGPASADAATIRALVAAGMDVARLNFSHGEHDDHRRFAERVREAARAEGRSVALLQDIQGPKIRVGGFPGGAVELAEGSEVTLLQGPGDGDAETLYVDYEHLLEDIQPGEEVLLADGLIRLRVTASEGDALRAEVLTGGRLGSGKGVAFPQSELRAPSVTDKDRRDLRFGRELGVDLVAASFVRSAADVAQVAELAGGDTPVVAKIELAVAYERLEEILAEAQGVMVARGDLGVQLPLQKIPLVQVDILARTNAAGRMSITATEMLESMTVNPRPTRAEVTDVASAILTGTDAVMLSGETASGKYPVRAVEMLDVICREIEGSLGYGSVQEGLLRHEEPFPSATAKSAVDAARLLGVDTIVAFTESGSTARLLSKYRPQARIVAFTPEARTYRQAAMLWGVRPLMFERLESTDAMIAFAARRLLELGICEAGEGVVMVAGVPPNERHSTNLMKLHRLGND